MTQIYPKNPKGKNFHERDFIMLIPLKRNLETVNIIFTSLEKCARMRCTTSTNITTSTAINSSLKIHAQ